MSKFKTGDLVRYIRGREGAATRSLRRPEHIEWRDSRVGLILSKTNLRKKSISTASVMYNVLWNDDSHPLIVPEWDLELVPNEI